MSPEFSLLELSKKIKGRDLSSREVFGYYLDRISRFDPELNAVVACASASGKRVAEYCDRVDSEIKSGNVRPLSGIPILVKDNICTESFPTSAGSRILEGFLPPQNAHCVQVLENAGAFILGKTNLDEFAMGSSSETSFFGPVKNPWNHQKVSGGSSGGSAAAVAAAFSPVSIGSDTGGSIRQPASFCGVIGFKPSYGMVSRRGLISYASSLDQVGSFAKSVADISFLHRILIKPDSYDATNIDFEDSSQKVDCSLKGARIGILRGGQTIDPVVDSSFSKSLGIFEGLGSKLEDVALSSFDYCTAAYYLIAMAEASSNLSRYDGVRYGARLGDSNSLEDMYCVTRSKMLGTEVKKRIMLGAFALSAGYKEKYYEKANLIRSALRAEYSSLLKNYDFIVAPVTPEPSFRLEEAVRDSIKTYKSDEFTILANLVGCPALSLPCGFDNDNGPIGFQMMGGIGDDLKLLKAAEEYEKYSPYKGQLPKKYL